MIRIYRAYSSYIYCKYLTVPYHTTVRFHTIPYRTIPYRKVPKPFSPQSSDLIPLAINITILLPLIQTSSHWDHIQCGPIQIIEKQCVNSLVSHHTHWTTATSALRPLGLKSATFDPWETHMHNDADEQCGPSSLCPQRATGDCRSYNLSWIHHPLGRGPLPSEMAGLAEQLQLHTASGAEIKGMAWDISIFIVSLKVDDDITCCTVAIVQTKQELCNIIAYLHFFTF